ncbi:hypothetical protein HT585_14695 [Ensifer sp. HO-A22]|jgi:hypothetical protein|uniref:Uncharacterized protein n=1 Tax=Ensifer oleiphilus TaxID=2742698 RepID=A0A7Y6UNY9_9HYPH|nr:hypothetical protein [Ensifer oleiphilus]NVD40113.1 hypothetical protein [Ensifer oleiphilus]
MMLQAMPKKRQAAVITLRFVVAGIVFGLVTLAIAVAVNGKAAHDGRLLPDLKIGFSIRW